MGPEYDPEFKELVMDRIRRGEDLEKLSKSFRIPLQTLRNWNYLVAATNTKNTPDVDKIVAAIDRVTEAIDRATVVNDEIVTQLGALSMAWSSQSKKIS